MVINCIIVEDEPLALERAETYVKKLPWLNLLNTFNNGLDALIYLKANSVDLIFLDINIGELTGIQLLESTKITAQVIITTAYQEYAIKGYELNVTDYLLKPYTFERFVQAVDKVKLNLDKNIAANKDHIFIKTEYRLEKILFDEILFIEGMRDYRSIQCINKRIMTLQTFTELEKEIDSSIVCRVHKSYMVSMNKIESVERDQIKIKDKYISISDTYKKIFFELLKK
jgi:two-component system LytT family response regulator